MMCVKHNFNHSAQIYIQSGDGLHVGGGGTTVRVGKTETYESMVVTSMPRTVLDDASCVKYGLHSSTCQEKSNSSVIKAQRVTEFSPAAVILNFTTFREARVCNLHHVY